MSVALPYGKCSYEREGLLEKIPYLKLMNGAFILREKDSDRLIELLEKYWIERRGSGSRNALAPVSEPYISPYTFRRPIFAGFWRK